MIQSTRLMRVLAVAAAMTASTVLAAGGGELFAQKCKACHGAEGQGNPAMAKMLKVTLRHLGAKEVQAKSDADLKKILSDGTGKMKPVPGLTAAQAAEIVSFVRKMKP